MLSVVVLPFSFSMIDSLWKNLSAPFQNFLLQRNNFAVQISQLIIRILDSSVFSVKILFLNN